MRTTIFLFGLVLLNLACGRFSEIDEGAFTTVRFNRGSDENGAKATLVGGILVYAYSTNFVTNLYLGDEAASRTIALPNGEYSFYAVGYETADMQGNLRCAVQGAAVPFVLNGQTLNVTLNLTQAQCNLGAFVNGGTYSDGTQIKALDTVHCGSSVGSAFPLLSGTSNCSAFLWTSANRFKVKAPIFVFRDGVYSEIASGIESGCQFAGTNGFNVTSQVRFPTGSLARPFLFPVYFETYSDASCTSIPLARHRFARGLVFGPFPSNAPQARLETTTTPFSRLFFREP